MSQRDYRRAEVHGDQKKCKSCQAWKDKEQDFNKWEGKCKMCRSAKRKGITIEEEMARLLLKSGIRPEESQELQEGRLLIEALKPEVARLGNESLQAKIQLQETIRVLQRSQAENQELRVLVEEKEQLIRTQKHEFQETLGRMNTSDEISQKLFEEILEKAKARTAKVQQKYDQLQKEWDQLQQKYDRLESRYQKVRQR